MRWRPGLLAGVVVLVGALALPAAAAASTPAVSESFSPGSVANGGITTLTFTIDNSQDTLPHSISFDDQLPAGIHLVGTPTAPNCVGAPDGRDRGPVVPATRRPPP